MYECGHTSSGPVAVFLAPFLIYLSLADLDFLLLTAWAVGSGRRVVAPFLTWGSQ